MSGTEAERRAWRSKFAVLVPEAWTVGSVAVIRSLGRAGYQVHACASGADALGLHSRLATHAVVHPPYADPAFPTWATEYVRANNIQAVVPSEAWLMALRDRHAEFGKLYPANADPAVLYGGMSKYEFFASARRDPALGENLPPTLLIDEHTPTPTEAELAALGPPIFIKYDALYGRPGETKGGVTRVATAAEARVAIEQTRSNYSKLVVQGYAPGSGVGAFFVVWEGRPLAEFMHLRLHEVPHTGGYSSFRRSYEDPRVMDDARRRLQAIGWQGPAMVEYRLDRSTGRFSLMELNGRFWGSLHLAMYAGVDFPTVLLDAFFGRPAPETVVQERHVAARLTFPADAHHLMSLLADGEVGALRKLRAVVKFFALALNPNIRSDLWYPGDEWLYVLSARRFFRSQMWRLSPRRTRPQATVPRTTT